MPHKNGDTRSALVDLVDEHGNLRSPNQFGAFLSDERLTPIVGSLWNCTDTMPGDLCETIGQKRGSTYAQGVRGLRADAGAA